MIEAIHLSKRFERSIKQGKKTKKRRIFSS